MHCRYLKRLALRKVSLDPLHQGLEKFLNGLPSLFINEVALFIKLKACLRNKDLRSIQDVEIQGEADLPEMVLNSGPAQHAWGSTHDGCRLA